MEEPFCGMIEEVHVLVIDQDKECCTDRMVDLLKFHKYKVTTVMAPAAMSMLSKGKKNIDVMIINGNSSDSHCFELLAQAVTLNIISLFVCDEHNKILAKKALDNGAYLYIQKSLDEQTVKHLWQFVLREKIQREKLINETNEDHMNINVTVRRKNRVKWDDDLHFKFTEAMKQLGEGRCYPANILKVMNVPNLTKNQVSSHLQKCRNNNWRPKKRRKYARRGSSSGSHIPLERKKRKSCNKFGRMPRLQTNVSNQTPRGQVFIPPILNTNNIFASSTQQQLHHPQLQVQPYYLNQSLSTQNNVGSGIQQQRSLLFGTFGSKNPIFVSTNHRSGLAFNSGDHHTQNDYSLNLNAAHVTTYPGRAMMSNINVGSAINNGLRATNVNIQQHIGEQNMFDPSNIVATSNVNDIEGSESNELDNCDVYLNFNNMDDLLQYTGSPSATLPNEHDNDSNTECPVSKTSKFPDA